MSIDICITSLNRARVELPSGRVLSLFQNCLQSLRSSLEICSLLEKASLYIVDFYSDELPPEEWAPQIMDPVKTIILKEERPFNRGKGLNVGLRKGGGDYVCALDTDIIVPPIFFQEGIHEDRCFFPICFGYDDEHHRNGHWLQGGCGLFIIPRRIFVEAGGVPEYNQYGREDINFAHRVRFRTESQKLYRPKITSLIHQYHPNELEWKSQHYEKPSTQYSDRSERTVQTKGKGPRTSNR